MTLEQPRLNRETGRTGAKSFGAAIADRQMGDRQRLSRFAQMDMASQNRRFMADVIKNETQNGIVRGQDICAPLGDFTLEHGDILRGDMVMARRYGRAGGPLIIIPGGISASRFVADLPDGPAGVGDNWWPELVGPSKAIDTNIYEVLGVDLAPSSDNDAQRVKITTRDQARRIKALMDAHGYERAHCIIGTSYGGMAGLAFCSLFPPAAGRLCLLGAAHRPYPMGVAWRGIQRRMIELAAAAGHADEGLSIARQLAMTTYRSPEEFSDRFTARARRRGDNFEFDVSEYLIAQGDKYPRVMSASRFLSLSESIDLHDIDPASVDTPCLLIATDTDRLAPLEEMQALADNLAGPAELVLIKSLYGHDSFLKEFDTLTPLLAKFAAGQRRAA